MAGRTPPRPQRKRDKRMCVGSHHTQHRRRLVFVCAV
jgi:hypothetical protein